MFVCFSTITLDIKQSGKGSDNNFTAHKCKNKNENFHITISVKNFNSQYKAVANSNEQYTTKRTIHYNLKGEIYKYMITFIQM